MMLCVCALRTSGHAQEEAFLKAWGAHVRTPNDHKAVIEVCQSVMDKSSTLGEFLVVKTLAAWHRWPAANRRTPSASSRAR